MRVLAISHLFPHASEPRYGIFVARQLQAMAACGAKITLIVPQPRVPSLLTRLMGRNPHKDRQLLQFEGITAISVPCLGLPGVWFKQFSGAVAARAMMSRVQQLHAETPFDVIYATNLFLGGDAAIRVGKELGIPAACLAIGTDVNVEPMLSSSLQTTYGRVVTGLDGVLSCGESLATEMEKLRTDKCLCVYGVVDLDTFRPAEDVQSIRAQLDLPRDRQIVLYVGYLLKEKGLFELIRAFEKTRQRQPEAMLVLCGEGKDGAELRSLATEFDGDAIRFVGAVEPDRVSCYMQAADLFVLPSYGEGMPNAVMEAMACGLPVVATQVGGLPAALGDCPAAILVPPRQESLLEHAIDTVLQQDAASRKQMRREARGKALASFGAKPNAKRILQFLQQLVDRAADAIP